LETEELATNCGEGQIDKPKKEQARSRGDADQEDEGEQRAESALILERAIARAKPTKGWEQVITFNADVRCGDLPLEIFHGGFGGQDSVLSNQTDDLGPQRDKRNQVDDRERAKKEPANEKVLRRLDVFSPKTSSQSREQGAMIGDEAVSAFGALSENRGVDVPVEQPLFVRIMREGTKRSFGGGVD